MKPRIKLAFFINSLEQGGAERQLCELIRGLNPERYDSSLILCNAKDQLGYDLPVSHVLSLDAPLFPTPASVRRLSHELRILEPDILHTYMGWENIFGRLAGKRAQVRAVVSSVRCTELPRKHVFGEALTRHLVDAWIVNSTGIREELAARARVRSEWITVVENGVDLKRFVPLTPQQITEERRRFGIQGRLALLLPGRVCRQKNQLGVVAALGRLKRQGLLPDDVQILFAGRENHWTASAELRARIRFAGLGTQVQLLGMVREIERLMGAVDGVLLPSYFEGLPNAVVEAMACGVPALVTPAANRDGLVTDGCEGLVIPDTSPQSIAQSLVRFFRLSPEERRALGERGLKHAERRFSVEQMVAGTVAVYERVLGLVAGSGGTISRATSPEGEH